MNQQIADGTAVTPQRQSYQEGISEIPEVQMENTEAPSKNPLIPAIETIARFVQLQEQKGNPSAAEMKQHLAAFMQSAMKASAPEAEQMPKEASVVEVPPETNKVQPEVPGNRHQNIQPLV